MHANYTLPETDTLHKIHNNTYPVLATEAYKPTFEAIDSQVCLSISYFSLTTLWVASRVE